MLTLIIPGRFRMAVADIASASAKYCVARELSGEGASTFPEGTIREGTKFVGRISYNGRVWANVDWRNGDKPIYDPLDSVTPRYNPEAVDVAIEQANRRSKVSGRERKMIHAILKGRG